MIDVGVVSYRKSLLCGAAVLQCVTLAVASLGSVVQPNAAFLTLLPQYQRSTGAACLDGSPPGYYWRPGIGQGADSWVIHLEGARVACCVLSVACCVLRVARFLLRVT